ncbi:MAG: hypothetical protein U5L02_19635 [Rheinheimera sp.]|nr:hypothetical protein [Rheinheimera sp.]
MSLTAVLPSANQLLLRPLLALVVLFAVCYGLGLDFVLSEYWYQLQGNGWALQHHWLTEDVLHRGARSLNQWLIATLLLHFVVQMCLQPPAVRLVVTSINP